MGKVRFFNTYSGIKPPVKPVGELEETELENRNTYIRAEYDDQDRLVLMKKITYGEVELAHRYEYKPDGSLALAEIGSDGENKLVEY